MGGEFLVACLHGEMTGKTGDDGTRRRPSGGLGKGSTYHTLARSVCCTILCGRTRLRELDDHGTVVAGEVSPHRCRDDQAREVGDATRHRDEGGIGGVTSRDDADQ